jgi:outer membrane protein assembly factor BamB
MRRPRALLILSLLWCLTGLSAIAQVVTVQGPWPQFHGPARNNLSPDTGLLTEWPDGGPPLLWEAQGAGRGYATVAIAGDRLYTLGDAPSTAEDKDEYVSCFDPANGTQLWLAKTGPAWTSGSPDWQSSRSTPTVDGERLYVLTAHGKLVCLESATGKEVWQKDLAKDLDGKKGDGWGYSESVERTWFGQGVGGRHGGGWPPVPALRRREDGLGAGQLGELSRA